MQMKSHNACSSRVFSLSFPPCPRHFPAFPPAQHVIRVRGVRARLPKMLWSWALWCICIYIFCDTYIYIYMYVRISVENVNVSLNIWLAAKVQVCCLSAAAVLSRVPSPVCKLDECVVMSMCWHPKCTERTPSKIIKNVAKTAQTSLQVGQKSSSWVVRVVRSKQTKLCTCSLLFFSKLPTHSSVQQFKPDVAYICVYVCVYFKMSPSYGLRGWNWRSKLLEWTRK